MKLSIPQRIRMLGMLQNFKGSLVDLKVVKELNDQLGFDEKEIKKDNIKVGANAITWDDKAKPKNIEIGDHGKGLFKKMLEDLDGKKELTMHDLELCELFMEGK